MEHSQTLSLQNTNVSGVLWNRVHISLYGLKLIQNLLMTNR